jgi:hypothetical protein
MRLPERADAATALAGRPAAVEDGGLPSDRSLAVEFAPS